MAGITISGIGSGLDVNQIVAGLIAAEKAPAAGRLDRREATLQAQLSGFGTFKGALADFRAALTGINTPARLQNLRATVGNDALFAASATSIAQVGTYNVEVQQLARAQKLVTPADQRFSAVTDTVGTGTLTFQIGTDQGGTFDADPTRAAKTITLDASNNTLEGVRDAINKANVGASASILNDGQGFRLVITASDSGTANSLKITVDDTGDGNHVDQSGLSRLAYDPAAPAGAGQNLTQTVIAQNALLTVDGVENITSASNAVVGVIPGVTLNLKSAQSGTTSTLTIAQDAAATVKAVDTFVAAYNSLIETTNTLTFYDAKTRERGILVSESNVRSIISQIRNVITGTVAGATGARQSLSDVGISFQKGGTLNFDSGRLQTALAEDAGAVAALFARTGSTTDPLISYKAAGSTSIAGTYAITLTQLASQGQYVGAALGGIPAPFVIDDDNNHFAIKVNGTQAGATVTLNNGTYATGAEMAAELQRQINANTTLINAGATLSVSYEASDNRFSFTSNAYGSSSSIEFTQTSANFEATLGLAVGAGLAGQDAGGRIGAEDATGSGRTLTGAGAAAGIAVDILGGATGPRGTVSLSGGIAQRLDSLLGNFLNNSGPLNNRTDSLNRQIEQIGGQRTALDQRLNSLEARYRAQFTTMDALVGRLNATSTYLTQQFFTEKSK